MITQNLKEKKEAKICHFRNLVALANSDGKISDEEKKFICELAVKWDIDKQMAEQAIRNPGSIQFIPPSDPKEKALFIIDMAYMAAADGEVSDVEIEFCASIAAKLRVPPANIKKLVKKIKSHQTTSSDEAAFNKELMNIMGVKE